MNRDRVALIVYLLVLFALTWLHEPWAMVAVLAVAVVVAGRGAMRLAKRALLSILLFNATVSIAFAVATAMRGELDEAALRYLTLLNARVFTMTFVTLLAGARINVVRALAFSPTIAFVLAVTYGQILSFRRMLAEFRMAFRSRSVTPPSARDRTRHAAATASYFFALALAGAREITMAMSSRGVFDDSR